MKKLILPLFLVLFQLTGFTQNTTPADFFESYVIKSLSASDLLATAKSSRNAIIDLKLDRWNLQLEESNIFAEGYRPNADLIPLKGYTYEGGRASITLGEDFIYGFIKERDKTFYIEPLWYYDKSAAKNNFIIYEIGAIKDTGPRTCGFTNAQNKKAARTQTNQSRQTGLCYIIEYGICCDYSMFDKYNTVGNVEAQVIGVTNDVNTNYDDEFDDELTFMITGIHTITTMGGDPWSASTDSEVLLPSFATWANTNLASAPISIAHDIASLWSNRDFDGTTIGLAYTPGACTSGIKYNILQDFSGNANSLRVLTAHELGHNLDANHDVGTNTFIMSPSVNNTTTWSAASIAAVEAYYNSQSCFSICAGTIPQVNFATGTSTAGESGVSGVGGPCMEPYIDITRTISLTNNPAADGTINITIDGTSTATTNYDFELITTSVTFTTAGSLTADVTIRIFDDSIEEMEETIVLNLASASANINSGFVTQHTITIGAVGDVVSANCCSTGAVVTYGGFNFSVSTIFLGGAEDAKTRTLITAAQLTAAGLTAGLIDQLSLYVHVKNSTGAFENFTIGLLEVTETTLNGTPWYTTQEVFTGDVTTVVSTWNDFTFTNLFDWDGTSNLYLDFCFDNSSVIGTDNVIGSSSGTSSVELMNYRAANGSSGCGLNSGSYTFFNDLQPHTRFRQVSGATIATVLNNTSDGRLAAGDVAHFYTSADEIICSIKNLGTTNMECIDVTINTAGNGQLNLPFGSNQYTAKSIQVNADNDAYYELTLYYTNAELTTWGGAAATLNIVQSTNPLASATVSNSTIYPTLEVVTGVGAGGGDSYRSAVFGDGYFAVTNAMDERIFSELNSADFVIQESGKGLLLKNKSGAQYLITANSSGVLTATLDNGATADKALSNCDFILPANGKGLILNGEDGSPTLIAIDNDGTLTSATIGAVPATKAQLLTGHLGLSDSGGGIIFKNSENECYKLVIDGLGNLVTIQVGCGS